MKFISLTINIFVLTLLLNAVLNRVVFKDQNTCKKYICQDELRSGTCLSFNPSEETINLKRCDSEDEFCNVFHKDQSEFKCEQKNKLKHTHSFPGGKCLIDSDCIFGTCEGNFCRGKNIDDPCDGHNQCPYKSSCRNTDSGKICTPLSKVGESCTDDFDCLNDLGCNKGTCIKYLSLPIGSEIDVSIRNAFPLCSSGFAYKGVCESFKNKDGEVSICDNEEGRICKYINSAGQEIQVKESCLCAKNSQGSRFCALGNNSNEWVEYINHLRNILGFGYDNCNTIERTLCRDNIDGNKEEYEKYVISSINATKQHELAGADTCVIDVFFPLMNKTYRKTLANRAASFRLNSNDKTNETKSFLKK